MIAGPDGRSNGTDSEKPTTAATTALSTADGEDAAHAARERAAPSPPAARGS